MSGPRPHVRLKVATGPWQKGHVFTDMPRGQAEIWVQRGVAEYVTADISASPLNRMVAAAPARRGRRRKEKAQP